ncbi:MAG: hypothetical protein KME43_03025 [Myxacorys chilensis ATA2-1-KO14]|jgi:hypothetical protein|nr:hypothetical protein [Myxacorys chilensis ATA2-1-KO14]
MAELESILKFIETIEQANPGQSVYEIANRLRGYTKPDYTTRGWTIATGYQQSFIDGTLNQTVVLAGELTDFGHFIASLSDQVIQPGLNFSEWTGDHTSWAGDVGSAIALYQTQSNKFTNLEEALNRFASDSDYVADVAAFVVGKMVNESSISQAIQHYDSSRYSDHVRTFLKTRFALSINGNELKNPAKLEADVRNQVYRYLELSPNTGVLKSLKDVVSQRIGRDVQLERDSLSADLLQGALHFLRHLTKKGELDSLKFKPYKLTQAPWLGTVDYDVTVSN